MTTTPTARKVQLYVLPTPDGWAIVAYGDDVLPDDEIVPLPLTSTATYDDAMAHVQSLPVAAFAGIIDGWSSPAELAKLEPDLAARLA